MLKGVRHLYLLVVGRLWFRLASAFGIVLFLISGISVLALGQMTARNFSQQFGYESDSQIKATAQVFESLDVIQWLHSDKQALLLLQSMRRGLQTAVLVSGAIALLLVTVIARRITKPLAQLHEATEALAGGNLGIRVPVKSRDEVGRVAAAFNYLADQLQSQEQLRRQIVADLAHELRTPVTVLQSDIEAMLDGLLLPTADELEGLHNEVRRLSRLIEDLRLLSLADAGQLTLYVEPVDVCRLLRQVVKRFDGFASEQQVSLCGEIPSTPLMIVADPDRLQQAVGNLLDNAFRYTPKNGSVRLAVEAEDDVVNITVADSGPGIAEIDLPRVFDRFWRSDLSRKRTPNHRPHNAGSGLGLAIVKHIAELHGGTVEATSPANCGALFMLSLPRASETLLISPG
jgi:two-component system, OmpR family, sensor histidine kinase BaeS